MPQRLILYANKIVDLILRKKLFKPLEDYYN